ncbi:hypothetical protein [Pseudomonas lutea]|uniref:Uncharacterized protein n=1 Tax=Pseudomonas lutea TaxID=243924 RepID=A0A9X0EAP4_9PSED|nr:hypothetical protein [Pseudomonas lutea]KGF62329.1 hypothetical protein LT42_24600 [Pseudomonas lutea]
MAVDDFERTQHVGHYRVVFTLIHFTVQPDDAASLRTINLPEIARGHFELIRLIEETYRRMLAQERPCRMVLPVSQAVSRNSADLLNDQRATIGTLVGSIGGKLAAPLGSITEKIAGATSASAAKNRLPTFHSGDVIVGIDAQVSGGIGPQRSSASLILKANGGR